MEIAGEQNTSTSTLLVNEPEEKYHYQPLDDEHRDFRLLEVLYRPESSEMLLQCKMIHVSMNSGEGVEYEAISYYWGDATPSRAITVDGVTLLLPINSEKALRRMASPGRSRVLFLDAVCINQDDLAERAAQVLLMGDIFRRATATLVHLGDSTTTTAQAFTNIRDLHLELQDYAHPKGGIQRTLEKRDVIKKRFRTPLNEEALVELFQRPWFRRAWVVQEVAVATKSSLMCGIEEIDLPKVLELTRWLSTSYLLHTSSSLHTAIETIDQIWEIRRQIAANDSLSTKEILTFGRFLNATDPTDRIYGMLGLLDRADSASALLAPDYAKPVIRAIRDAVRQCFADPDLPFAILSEVYHPDDPRCINEGIPSWVPRLDLPYYEDGQPAPLNSHDTSNRVRGAQLTSMAGKTFDEEPSVLHLNGIELCSVEKVSVPLIWDLIEGDKPFEVGTEWIVWEILPFFRHRPDLSMSSIARTLIIDTDVSSGHCSKDSRLGLKALLEHFRDGVSVPNMRDGDATIDGDDAAVAGSTTAQASNYYQSMFLACRGRRLAILDNGTIGLVPRVTRAGDMVVMMQGAHMPLMIRPEGEDEKGEVFSLIGECYVDGWMSWQVEFGWGLKIMMEAGWSLGLRSFRIR